MAKRKSGKASAWGRIRRGAHRIDLYDEGGGLFLYDEAHAAAIASDLPRSLGSAADPAHARLAKAGQLVTIRLEGDGMAKAELSVGPPLSDQERTALTSFDPQEAFLDLPSGRLHVETPSTIPIPWTEPDGDPGFVTDVPLGRYRLTLYRLDRRARDPQHGPFEFIALTALSQDENLPATPAVVPWPEPRDDAWVGKYSIEGGVFRGLARFGNYWDSFRVNLDSPAARSLGLEHGAGLHVRVPEVGLEAEAVYCTTIPVLVELTAAETRGLAPEFAVAHWEGTERQQPFLSFLRVKTKLSIAERHWEKWLPTEVRIGPSPKLPKSLKERLEGSGPDLLGILRLAEAQKKAPRAT